MPIFETFSKRQKRIKQQGNQDVYQYDTLPQPFRVQIIHIWQSAIGPYVAVGQFEREPSSNGYWRLIHDTLARETGVFNLGESHKNHFVQSQQFLLNADLDGALDIIELSFRVIDRLVRELDNYQRKNTGIKQDPADAIEELNQRFREHGIGYQFEAGELMRVDSQYVHAEAVKPAISLLQDQKFIGAADEFLRAHEHYRAGRNKEAIAEALKAFESTMKTICDIRHWVYPKNATAVPLIQILVKNGLIPLEMQSQFSSLRSLLESGLPTLRNKPGSGHGQGAEEVVVPDYVASFALHMAASNIVFLVEAYKANK